MTANAEGSRTDAMLVNVSTSTGRQEVASGKLELAARSRRLNGRNRNEEVGVTGGQWTPVCHKISPNDT